MGMGRVYAAVLSLALAVPIAAALMGPVLVQTPLQSWAERWRPSVNITEYTYTPSPGLTTFIGDFAWGLARVVQLLGSTPQMAADLLAALGVPQPWAQAIITVVELSLAAYIVYMVSGRILSARD